MKTVTPQADDSFVYSCSSADQWGYEQFIPEHILAYQVSGETHIFHQQGTFVLKKNKKPSDIYLDLGFENLSHFYTAFKQKYGVTPIESLTIKK